MIELDGVSVVFDGRMVLDSVACTLKERRIAIIGANGSGKSTFARLLNGLQLPTSGVVRVAGDDTKTNGKTVRRKIGFVFQNPDNQIIMPIVEEDLAFGLKNLGLSKDEIKQRIDNILQRFSLEALRTQPSHFLSGGQKQLLAICGTLIMEPQTIIFDEPTTQLDLKNKRHIMAAIKGLSQQVIMVSHDLDYLDDFERVLVFDKGRIVMDAAPQTAIAYYQELMRDNV